MAEPPAPPGLAGMLGWLPLPVLVLAADGSAVAASPAWATLSPVAAGGEGRLEAVEPTFRAALGHGCGWRLPRGNRAVPTARSPARVVAGGAGGGGSRSRRAAWPCAWP